MRKALFQLHLWLGLVVGLAWALQGLTGASLVFHREMDRWAKNRISHRGDAFARFTAACLG